VHGVVPLDLVGPAPDDPATARQRGRKPVRRERVDRGQPTPPRHAD